MGVAFIVVLAPNVLVVGIGGWRAGGVAVRFKGFVAVDVLIVVRASSSVGILLKGTLVPGPVVKVVHRSGC